MGKSLLIICQHSPWSDIAARETLDVALAGGAFDIAISLLFLNDGVFQLTTLQQPSLIEQKNLCANLQVLPLFGIENLFVTKQNLAERGLHKENLALPVKVLETEQLAHFFENYDVVLTL